MRRFISDPPTLNPTAKDPGVRNPRRCVAGNQEGRKSAIAVNAGVEMWPPTSVRQIIMKKSKNASKNLIRLEDSP
jgi:hypothetical protein